MNVEHISTYVPGRPETDNQHKEPLDQTDTRS